MHLTDAFIQSDLQYIQDIHFLSVYVPPGDSSYGDSSIVHLLIVNIYSTNLFSEQGGQINKIIVQ